MIEQSSQWSARRQNIDLGYVFRHWNNFRSPNLCLYTTADQDSGIRLRSKGKTSKNRWGSGGQSF